MNCPTCHSNQSAVKDSRNRTERVNLIYRRRVCLECRTAWTTYEIDAAEYDRLKHIETTRHQIREFADTFTDAVSKIRL